MSTPTPPPTRLADVADLPPRDGGGPVFRAPWEAHAFAIVVELHRRGCFGWDEWTRALSAAIAAAQAAGDPDLGDRYYHHWLVALETLLDRKGLAPGVELERLRGAWARAAARTPHGRPVELDAADLPAAG